MSDKIIMNCPYCGKEMERGLIQSPQELSWLGGDKRQFFGRAEFHDEAVVLSKLSFLTGSAVRAFLCRDCMKVIIDYSDEKSDFNADK